MKQNAAPPAHPSVLRVQAVLVSIALVAGLAIATVYEWTRPMVQAQRGGLLGDAALEVLPAAVTYRIYARDGDGGIAPHPGGEGAELFIGLDDAGQPAGAAIVASGMGYQDVIQLVYGLDPGSVRLLGMRVVGSRETPGLGSRIVDDQRFVGGFTQVKLQFAAGGELQTLQLRGAPEYERGEIDTLTGATVSAQAVAGIIDRSLAEWLPLLRAHYDGLTRKDDG
jgi:electron transport complex protein RnfG